MWDVPILMACLAAQLPALAHGAETETDPLEAADSGVPHRSGADESQSEDSPARFDTGYRFRFGIAFVSGATLLPDGVGSIAAPAVLGLDLRLGVQINDLFAVMTQSSLTFLDLRASALFEVTPIRYFSAGVGVGVNFIDIPGAVLDPATGSDGAVIVPVRLAFNLPLSAYETTPRTAISLEVNLMPGMVYEGPPVDYRRFEFGIIGGVGFELY